ncbi:MAG: N-acyl homoserine lactonase family protein [Candidatus Bathyarchaeia archaeon]
MLKYRIRALPILKTHYRNKSMLLYLANGSHATWTNYVYYIEGAKRNIIIDTASPVEEITSKGNDSSLRVEGIKSFEEALEEIGLKPTEIDLVILTHLHVDHYLNVFKCANAEVVIQEEELKFASSPHPLYAWVYPKEPLEKLKRMNLRIVRGDEEIDDGINILFTPGHTPGCQSIMVETSKGPVIITGFCCTRENFEPKMDTLQLLPPGISTLPVIPPGIHTDVLQAYDSMIKIKRLASIIVPLTDDNNPRIIG